MLKFKLYFNIITIIQIVSLYILFIISYKVEHIEKINLPIDNFVLLKIERYINNSFCDCHEDKIKIEEYSASGVAFKSIEGESYILTAAHFCHSAVNFEEYPYFFFETNLSITNRNQETFKSEIVYMNQESDLCLVKSSTEFERDIDISFSLPEIGEKVHTMSAPHGIHGPNAVPQFEGIFSGCYDKHSCLYTMPATYGSSGSPIINKNGYIVGMIHSVTTDFSNISVSAESYQIYSFLKEYEELSGTSML